MTKIFNNFLLFFNRVDNYLVAESELDPFFLTFNLVKSFGRNFILLIEFLQDQGKIWSGAMHFSLPYSLISVLCMLPLCPSRITMDLFILCLTLYLYQRSRIPSFICIKRPTRTNFPLTSIFSLFLHPDPYLIPLPFHVHKMLTLPPSRSLPVIQPASFISLQSAIPAT